MHLSYCSLVLSHRHDDTVVLGVPCFTGELPLSLGTTQVSWWGYHFCRGARKCQFDRHGNTWPGLHSAHAAWQRQWLCVAARTHTCSCVPQTGSKGCDVAFWVTVGLADRTCCICSEWNWKQGPFPCICGITTTKFLSWWQVALHIFM